MKDDNNTGTRKAVFVLGMHRSGTSATAGVLHYAGIDFGNRLLSGKPDNPKGFFEHEEIWNIHETLLNDLGSSWDDIRPLPLDWLGTEAAQSASARLGEIIDVEFSRLQVWGLKDPRLSRLFPLWFPILKERSITPLIVLAIRHPLEVAQSLHRRDKIGLSHGLALWLRYTLEAEQSSRNFRRIVQHYPSLISDWRAELENISNRLGLSCSELSASTQIRIDRFIDKDLRHESSCQQMTNYSISTHLDDLCTKAYNQIKILNENSDTEILDEIYSKLSYFEKNTTHYSEISGLYIKFSIEKT
ncbi:MAG TPA: hypothetical protein PK677_15940, partial [Acidiphilium sp.]|nr:hypothetical protein [Acidiphilium sp.]